MHSRLSVTCVLVSMFTIYTYQNFDIKPACGCQRIASPNGCADDWSTDFVTDSRTGTDMFTCLPVSLCMVCTYQNFDVKPACGFQRMANGCADDWSTDFVTDSRTGTDLFTCLRVSLFTIYTYQNFEVKSACGFQRMASPSGCADGWSTDFVTDSRTKTDLFTCLRVSLSTFHTYQNSDINPACLKISATCSRLRP